MTPDAAPLRLLAVALEGAHPAYFSGLQRDLLARARASSLGRRLLLGRLLERNPALLEGLRAFGGAPAANHAWVFRNAAWLHEAAADLGAIALVPALRGCVDRASVLRLRTAIGSRRLAMALNFNPGARVPDAINAVARRELAVVIGDADAIAALVARRGYRELAGYACRLNPAVGERVRLAFHPDWRDDPEGTWLPADAVAHYFAEHAAEPEDSAGDPRAPAVGAGATDAAGGDDAGRECGSAPEAELESGGAAA